MTTNQASKLEKRAKEDFEARSSAMGRLLAKGKDAHYEKWLSEQQSEARIIENNL
ncbi:MAG: hypothetical protein WC806_06535 [Candidatus Gracilibacteria bacterium]|jgi:hypothetical protein